jgi:hypothetical protein
MLLDYQFSREVKPGDRMPPEHWLTQVLRSAGETEISLGIHTPILKAVERGEGAPTISHSRVRARC